MGDTDWREQATLDRLFETTDPSSDEDTETVLFGTRFPAMLMSRLARRCALPGQPTLLPLLIHAGDCHVSHSMADRAGTWGPPGDGSLRSDGTARHAESQDQQRCER